MTARADLLSRVVRDHPVVIEARLDHRCRGGAGAGVHSYLGDGRMACWVVPPAAVTGPAEADPPVGWAVDAEVVTQPVPLRVGARWEEHDAADPEQFWRHWCATEVLAKLADVPVVLLLRDGPVMVTPVRRGPLEVHWAAQRVGDVLVVHGLGWTSRPTQLT
jgi:hypothetical protein